MYSNIGARTHNRGASSTVGTIFLSGDFANLGILPGQFYVCFSVVNTLNYYIFPVQVRGAVRE